MLITGASGFIGGRLVAYLIESGVAVRAASRIARDWPRTVDSCVTDLDDPDSLFEACRAMQAVVNLTALGEAASADDPEAASRVNTRGAAAWASAASRAGVARFVQVSTAKVYGANLVGTVTEETPCRPLSPYAVCHLRAEREVDGHHANVVILRLANAFGAPTSRTVPCWGTLVNEFCCQAAVTRRITITSSGLSWRNIVPMSDVVRAIGCAALGLRAGIYNLGSQQALQLRGIAELVSQMCLKTLGFLPPVACGMPAPGERHAPLDYRIDRIGEAGFTPNAPLGDEIRETLKMADTVC